MNGGLFLTHNKAFENRHNPFFDVKKLVKILKLGRIGTVLLIP